MYARPASPQPIGGVLDDAIKLYRASFRGCWPIAAAAAVLSGVVSISMTLSIFGSGAVSNLTLSRVAALNRPGFMLLSLLNYLVQIGAYGALILYQTALADGDAQPSLSDATALTLRRLWSAALATILSALVIGVGCVLLLVPGIYLMGALCLWPVCVFADSAGPLEGLRQSRDLIRGHWWRTTTILTVAIIILVVLSSVVSLFAGALVGFGRRDPLTLQLSIQGASMIATVFILPFMPAVLVAMYHDLKLRREGSDIAARLGAMAPS